MQRASIEKKERPMQRPHRTDDFFSEILGKRVNLYTVDGHVFSCTILEVSTYQLKIQDDSGKTLYINKGYIAYIEPL